MSGFPVDCYGALYWRAIKKAQTPTMWATQKCFPNITTINAGGTFISTYQVPIEDTRTLYLGHRAYRFPEWVNVPEQDEVQWFEIPTHDANGDWIRDDIVAQDIMVMTAQGPIVDRPRELLGTTDIRRQN